MPAASKTHANLGTSGGIPGHLAPPKPALPPLGCKSSVLGSPAAEFVPFASVTRSPLFRMETAPQHLGGPPTPAVAVCDWPGLVPLPGEWEAQARSSGWVGPWFTASVCLSWRRMKAWDGGTTSPPATGACGQHRVTRSLCPVGQSLSQRNTITQDDPGFASESDILPCGYLP